MRAGVFKFCIHIESGQVYCGTENKTAEIQELLHIEFGTNVVNHLLFYVKENQTPPTYSSLNFFIFLSLQFSDIK